MSLHAIQVMGQQTSTTTVLVDDEYDRYKKRADDSFREGDYHQALRQYHNCLAVPGFETNGYVLEKINLSTNCLNLRLQAETALQQGNGPEAMGLLDQLLKLNSDDSKVRSQIIDYYENEGRSLLFDKKITDSIKNYERALSYADEKKKNELVAKIKEIKADRLATQLIKIKMATGVVAVGAAVYALLLRNDYISKISALNQISLAAENPTLPGTIDDADTYSKYKDAYAAAQAAERKEGLYIASVSLAAVATLAEVYLLRKKPKRENKPVTWKPSPHLLGLAVRYTF